MAYGFDGELAGQVLDLMRVLEQAGWRPYLPTRRLMTGLQPIRSIPGPNGAAIGDRPGTYGQHEGSDPPHLQLVGPREAAAPPCTVQVVWTTRSDPGHTRLDPAFPAPRAALRRTPSYQPLEFSGALLPADISDFAAPALEQHEHAVAVMIELGYYYNRQAHTRPHRLPARLMPKLW